MLPVPVYKFLQPLTLSPFQQGIGNALQAVLVTEAHIQQPADHGIAEPEQF